MMPPPISDSWALFLDLDGTLIDIAAAPDEVTVPAGLPETLRALRDRLSGALAIVSGRGLERLDKLLSPAHLPLAAEHGALVRLPSGPVETVPGLEAPPREWVEALRTAALTWPGALIEVKSFALAVHFRRAPAFEDRIRKAFDTLLRANRGDWCLIESKMALELRHAKANKGHAVARFMSFPPFATRTPVFVGDDVTDEDGIAMAQRLGGFGLRVKDAFAGEPRKVRAWLLQALRTGGIPA